MVKLKLGGVEYPLVLTVGAMDELAQMGVTLVNLFQYIQIEGRTFEEAVEHGLELLDILLDAGSNVLYFQTGEEQASADRALLRRVLTPGQIWGLCEAAVLDSLKRTVEADHSKNGESAVGTSP